jgi:hypothetical protein
MYLFFSISHILSMRQYCDSGKSRYLYRHRYLDGSACCQATENGGKKKFFFFCGMSCIYVLAAYRYSCIYTSIPHSVAPEGVDKFYPCSILMSLSVCACQTNMYILVTIQGHFTKVQHTQNSRVLCNVSINSDARE